ncbi:type IV secretion system DNA-binding domain-containing protein [Actinomycetes bacterium KLBMP 9797]
MSPTPAPSPRPSGSVDPNMVPTAPHSPLLDLIERVTAWAGPRPWLAAVAAAAVVLIIVAITAARTAVWRWRHARLVEHAQQVHILPPPEVDPDGVHAWWATLYEVLAPSWRRRLLYGTPHVAMEYRWTGRELTIQVWVPGTVPAGPVAAAARAAWPGAACTITPATKPLPTKDATAEGGALAPTLPAWYPLETEQDTDPMRALVQAGTGLHATEHACVQVLARPATARQVAKLRQGAAALRTGRPPGGGPLDPATWLRGFLDVVVELFTPTRTTGRSTSTSRPVSPDPLRERDARPAMDKTIGAQWEVAIRYAVAHVATRAGADRDAITRRLVTLAHGLASSYGAFTGRNRLRRLRLPQPLPVLTGRPLRRGFLLSADELSAIAALPTDLAVAGLDRARAKAVPAPVAVPTGGRNTKVLGRAEVGGHAVAVPIADARQHIHLMGSTGSGKSTQMCHMAIDDIRAGRGVVVIDPKGDTASDILDRLPATLAHKIVLIDPDQPGGATLNPLEGVDDDLLVDNVVSIFSKIFSRHWGPRIDDVLRVACLTLMRKANAHLGLVSPLLNDKQFRAAFTVDLDDPAGLKGFWEWYEATPPPLRAQIIGPVLARLRAFLLRDFVRRTLGVPKSSFDMSKVLDGGILIARLPKGQLGEETAKLMGSFVFASVWQAATARARLPEDRRRDCSVFVDEAHNVLNLAGSVGDMLAEARGYHVSLTLAHQNLAQLPRETQLALSANARNKIYFSCSPEDAHQLARHTQPELDEHDLNHLDAYTAAARLVVGSRETAAFTMRTRAPLPIVGETTAIRQAVARPEPDELTGIEQLAQRSSNDQPTDE